MISDEYSKDSKQATPSDCNSSHGPKGDLKICISYSEILYTSLTSTVNLKGHGKEPENVQSVFNKLHTLTFSF
jgi:hypothetical protein